MSDGKQNAKLRRWMLVINNPTSKESIQISDLGESEKTSGLIWSAEHMHDEKENEGKNDTEHYHVYVVFKQPWRYQRIKTMFPRAHIEPAKKTSLACARYVAKDGFYVIYKNIPDPKTGDNTRPGSRRNQEKISDLERVQLVNAMKNGTVRMKDLTAEQLLDKKLVGAIKEARNMTLGPRRPDLRVCVFIAPSGWGKSFAINETFLDIAEIDMAQNEWFLNPEGNVMLFDEFCGQIRCTKMLRYLDEYKVALPIKGGHCPCYFKAIFICSNTSPDQWYTTEDPRTGEKKSSIPDDVRKALYRRIGYPLPSLRRECHIYDPQFTKLEDARKEMNEICKRIYKEIFADEMPEHISDDEDENQILVPKQKDHEQDPLQSKLTECDPNVPVWNTKEDEHLHQSKLTRCEAKMLTWNPNDDQNEIQILDKPPVPERTTSPEIKIEPPDSPPPQQITGTDTNPIIVPESDSSDDEFENIFQKGI